jgi:hypothetical protein
MHDPIKTIWPTALEEYRAFLKLLMNLRKSMVPSWSRNDSAHSKCSKLTQPSHALNLLVVIVYVFLKYHIPKIRGVPPPPPPPPKKKNLPLKKKPEQTFHFLTRKMKINDIIVFIIF